MSQCNEGEMSYTSSGICTKNRKDNNNICREFFFIYFDSRTIFRIVVSPFIFFFFFKTERIPRLKMITCASTEAFFSTAAFFSEVFQPRTKRVGSKRVKGATGCERETAFKEVQRESEEEVEDRVSE